ncbi:MAG TPA: MBL fold metallo-hydrolase [Nitrolancea sp.]|jgi:glyoxylase-like metal-dependent hydrolase (beta-lactamase superfamily II)|nr:MBL fold metallo-hydrolase [Nitrolancea sp.]
MNDIPGVHQFPLGTFTCTVFRDGEETAPTEPEHFLAFVNATNDEVVEAHRAYTAATGDPAALTSMNILLIDTGSHRVLVDTGCGPNPADPANGKLLELLEAAGISPNDIDTVIITHGHWDHVDGNTDGQGNPTFPNARYVVSDVEWEVCTTDPSDGNQAQFLSIADRFDQISMDAEIVSGIRAIPAPGHTLGQIALLIESNGDRLLHTADTFHHQVELVRPEWYFDFDADPEATVRTRREVFDRAASEQLPVITYHLPFPGLGHIVAEGDHWIWEPQG